MEYSVHRQVGQMLWPNTALYVDKNNHYPPSPLALDTSGVQKKNKECENDNESLQTHVLKPKYWRLPHIWSMTLSTWFLKIRNIKCTYAFCSHSKITQTVTYNTIFDDEIHTKQPCTRTPMNGWNEKQKDQQNEHSLKIMKDVTEWHLNSKCPSYLVRILN